MPPRRWHALGLIILPAFFFFENCSMRSRVEPEDNPILVRVGEKSYTKSDLNSFFADRLSELQDSGADDQIKSALLSSFIEEKLLLLKAGELKIEPDAKALEKMAQRIAAGGGGSGPELKGDKNLEQSMMETLKAQGYLRNFLFKNLVVSKEDCEAYYRDHLGDFVRNDVVHVREILVDSPELAKKIQASLKAGRNRNFQELARQYSKAPTASEGGDLGSFQRGELPQELEKAIFPLAPGTVSKIVSTQYGYHIFKVEEKILAHQQTYYEVEDQIQERLLLERQRAAYEAEMASLTQQFPIQIEDGKLGFKYAGFRPAVRGGRPQ
jgi:parvulin-like peptidyl-prolyl isomerase